MIHPVIIGTILIFSWVYLKVLVMWLDPTEPFPDSSSVPLFIIV